MNDIRSKIDCRGEDTKIRLIDFFDEVRSNLLVDSDIQTRKKLNNEHRHCLMKRIKKYSII